MVKPKIDRNFDQVPVTGRSGVYMMYPGPAGKRVRGGPPVQVGAPLGLGGGSALPVGGVAPLLGPALDPGLGPHLGLGPAGRVVGV